MKRFILFLSVAVGLLVSCNNSGSSGGGRIKKDVKAYIKLEEAYVKKAEKEILAPEESFLSRLESHTFESREALMKEGKEFTTKDSLVRTKFDQSKEWAELCSKATALQNTYSATELSQYPELFMAWRVYITKRDNVRRRIGEKYHELLGKLYCSGTFYLEDPMPYLSRKIDWKLEIGTDGRFTLSRDYGNPVGVERFYGTVEIYWDKCYEFTLADPYPHMGFPSNQYTTSSGYFTNVKAGTTYRFFTDFDMQYAYPSSSAYDARHPENRMKIRRAE